MSQPNILLIHADQHRSDCLGCYGNPDVRTPNIDAIAADGVRYENSFCPYPVCTPSRYSLLSSQYVHQHLGWSNHCTLPAGIPTFPKELRAAGYRTKAVGKMHFAPTYLDVGFDEMLLAEQDGPGRFDDDYHRWLREEGLVDAIDLMDQRSEYRRHAPQEYWDTVGAMTSDLNEAHHSTTWIAERAMEELATWGPDEDTGPGAAEDASRNPGRARAGHLLMVGFIKPHHPFDPPAPWDGIYDPTALSILPGWLDEPLPRDIDRSAGYFPHVAHTETKLRLAMANYYATISQIDYHVGRMVDLLKEHGLYDNTLIVYTSDHGDYLGFHHLLLKGNYMYDPVVKVPLIVKYPKVGSTQPRAGEVSDELVNNVDVGPTLLQAAGCNVPDAMMGHDLAADCAADVVFAENWAGQEYMVRTATAKLLVCKDAAKSQFFDLIADPLEMTNCIDAPEYQPTIAALKQRLLAWMLFEGRSRVHLDYDAPVIDGSNVPQRDDGHVDEMAAYFARRMETRRQA